MPPLHCMPGARGTPRRFFPLLLVALWVSIVAPTGHATDCGSFSRDAASPNTEADIVIGTEADFADHNYVRNNTLGGFDIELTHAVCRRIGKQCAIVRVPWQSIWTSNYSRFGWKTNTLNYPGEGHHNRWFHCAVGTYHLVERQQSIAFTHPYTDSIVNEVGFVVPDAVGPAFPANAEGKRVGVMAAWAASTYLLHPVRSMLVRWGMQDQQAL